MIRMIKLLEMVGEFGGPIEAAQGAAGGGQQRDKGGEGGVG